MSAIDPDSPGQHSAVNVNPIKNVSSWVDLPPELLVNIFTHLKLDALENQEYERNKLSLLSTRLVHPRWKLVIDEFLEKWCMEFWTKWKPNLPSDTSNPYNFPTLNIRKKPTGFEMKHILSPTNLRCPFPTKSVCITEGKKPKTWTAINFLPKLGNNLTSITFFKISLDSPLLPKTLANILSCTPNLKAIAIQNVFSNSVSLQKCQKCCLKEPEPIVLPPLPHLEHVKLSLKGYNFVDWILKPYAKQLITLETEEYIEWNPEGDELSYRNLKRLKIHPSPLQIPEAPTGLHSLQFLSLGGLRIFECGPTSIQQIQKFISHFCTTLVDLHLGIRDYIALRPRVYGRLIRTYKQGVEDKPAGPPFTNFVYPLLKTFWIFFPRTEKEVGIVNDFLKMFPALETLVLLQEFGKLDEEMARNCLVEEKFWRVCPKLKNIRVEDGYTDKVIFKMQAPFS